MKRLPKHIEHWDDEHYMRNGIIVTLQPGWSFYEHEHNLIRGFDTVAEARQQTAKKNLYPCNCEDCQDDLERRNRPPEEQAEEAIKSLHDDVTLYLKKYDTGDHQDESLLVQAVKTIHAAYRELEELQRVVPTLDRAAAAVEAGDYDQVNTLLASLDENFLDNAGLRPQDLDPEAPEFD